MVTMSQKHSFRQSPQLVPWVLMSDSLAANAEVDNEKARQMVVTTSLNMTNPPLKECRFVIVA
jgi:hypothetical protein